MTLLVVLLLAFGAIGIRLFDLQGRDRARLAALGLEQRIQTVPLAAERGSIFDRNGADLAVSVPQTTITADPRVIDDADGYARQLAALTGADERALSVRLSRRDSAFAYVARQVDDETAAKVRALELPGISFVAESKRFYPSGALAAPLLGFVGTDNQGLAGLEVTYEDLLQGRAGTLELERDPHGQPIPGGERHVKPARRGKDLVLTIDRTLQYEVETALAEQVNAARAKGGGMAIVADIRTGDILAMATVTGYSPDTPSKAAPATAGNRPVTDVYEPGSTNKVVTMSGAIEQGLVTPATPMQVPQEIRVGNQTYSDVEVHGLDLTVADVLRESSNVGTIMIADRLGPDNLDKWLRAFGFGTRTGLNFPGEAAGILLPRKEFNATSMGSIPIGNGIAVSALQMLEVYMTIANGGVARAPRLVAATLDAKGERHDEPPAETHQIVSTSTANQVRDMLTLAVSAGTGKNAALTGYQVAGKTGTARKPPYEKPPYKYMASFAGFAPADAPRLASIVVMDEPDTSLSIFGGDVAAPVFKRIMQFALRLERVPTTGR